MKLLKALHPPGLKCCLRDRTSAVSDDESIDPRHRMIEFCLESWVLTLETLTPRGSDGFEDAPHAEDRALSRSIGLDSVVPGTRRLNASGKGV